MRLTTDFKQFLSAIRPTVNQRNDLKRGHRTLRKRLRADKALSKIVISDFLQGSYARHTVIKPRSGKRSDVDIIVVTRLDESDVSPQQAMDTFTDFLNKHYKGKWKQNGRSLGIELSYVDLDLVVTSAPSESQAGVLESLEQDSDGIIDFDCFEEPLFWSNEQSDADGPQWKSELLRIPDRDVDEWQDTHPLGQLDWTRRKNADTNGHFVNIVKCFKWWRLEHDGPRRPKGFLLERIVADCCPDGVKSVAQGFTLTMENICVQYDRDVVPVLPDYCLPETNVLMRLSPEDFAQFHDAVSATAPKARAALDCQDLDESRRRWREILGSTFPQPKATAMAKPDFGVAHRQPPQWAMKTHAEVSITASYRVSNAWTRFESGDLLPTGADLEFVAETTLTAPLEVYWQTVNTGAVAADANGLRGTLEPASSAGRGGLRHRESTKYAGEHWVECFIVSSKELLARSGPFVVRIQ